MMSKMKRALSLLAVLVLLAGALPLTEAKADSVMYVTASYLYLRSAAGMYGVIIGGAWRGTAVTVYSSPRYNYWYYVRLPNGQTGYMYKDYLTFGYNTNTNTNTNTNKTTAASGTAVTSRDVNLRTGPGYNFGIIYLVPKGTNVTLTGKNGSWYAVKVGGSTGYMLASLLKVGSNNTTANVTVTAASGTAVTSRDVNLRTGPGYDYNVIYLTPKGTSVTLTGKSGNWYRVSVGGTSGYMLASLLKVNTTNTGNGKTTVTNTMNVSAYTNHKANMRTGAGSNYTIMYTLDAGEWLTVTGSYGSWYKISYNGKTGWMLKSLVQIVR